MINPNTAAPFYFTYSDHFRSKATILFFLNIPIRGHAIQEFDKVHKRYSESFDMENVKR